MICEFHLNKTVTKKNHQNIRIASYLSIWVQVTAFMILMLFFKISNEIIFSEKGCLAWLLEKRLWMRQAWMSWWFQQFQALLVFEQIL